ncbi:MAG: cob(I)yrinic acid a,c-diamide adenosyltransferase [Armatimonadota bacterium]|nr:cob(I)yrinic acid a,c-diamide adenosyltransferase [Armatimonadota bacterium]MDR7440030.1 cob(I)yrinic acid a,c-diamide adenosyltransferase [Armatimonadota bacterium]MDR7562499.1 cob(I)yrinic acid a,c-diamide adenosyltransferase [Armatimonadota bacterium]MDR7566802.1 cob(I)yrinic acid a,c-diamide adenosyltransferase [Armatimonadota bacterium]MDR7601383.1 cob(I)yrinic acid a,c-diamide adenosyltransferase [Armatimonadota bacterium]
MRIYTRTGDGGRTALWGGERVWKDHPRVEAYGTVDELCSVLGVVRRLLPGEELPGWFGRIQETLYCIAAELAAPHPKEGRTPRLAGGSVEELEHWIDQLSADLPPIQSFLLPGGTEAGAWLHLARAVARRAERRVVTLARQEPLNPEILRYLNRLSDLLFVAARWVNFRAGVPERPWPREPRP